MNLNKIIVLQCAQYAAPYEGNFIKSLKNLESALKKKGAEVAYVLPMQARNQPWFAEFNNRHQVFTIDTHDRAALHSLLTDLRPAIIHTHFEGYDVSVAKAAKPIAGYNPSMVWHLHDWFCYLKHPLKALYMRYGFFKHYCLNASGVSVIGVCDEMVKFVSKFKRLRGRDFYRKQTILNGIDLTRIEQTIIDVTPHNPFTFLTFGGRNIQKRVDVVFNAFMQIFENNPNAPYKLLITKGIDTELIISRLMGGGKIPSWCELVPQQEDINKIFAKVDCFISASDCETFSYAVCEASIYGLPVIQTNIPGTKWNNDNPSTFLITPGSASELAAQIEHVVETYPILTQPRMLTRKNNLKYTLQNWSAQIIEFYQEL